MSVHVLIHGYIDLLFLWFVRSFFGASIYFMSGVSSSFPQPGSIVFAKHKADVKKMLHRVPWIPKCVNIPVAKYTEMA